MLKKESIARGAFLSRLRHRSGSSLLSTISRRRCSTTSIWLVGAGVDGPSTNLKIRDLCAPISHEFHASYPRESGQANKIESWMSHISIKRHSQAFGTAPVHDLLRFIKMRLPQIAKEVGVDVIMSKWEFDYLSPNAEVRDVTMLLVKAYEPKPELIASIHELMNTQPLTPEEIVRQEVEGGH